jgi:ankyrin repeat protein
VAIRTGNIDMVRLLLQRGANVNTEGGNVNIPIYEAVVKGRIDIVRLLREQSGIDVNVPQNVAMSYHDVDDLGLAGEPYEFQVPETALGFINRIHRTCSTMSNEWQIIVGLLRTKGARY